MGVSDTIPEMHQPRSPDSLPRVRDWSPLIVLWGSVAQAVVGTTYLVAVVVGILRGVFVIPLPDWLETVGAIATMAEAPLLVMVVAALGASAGNGRRALAVIAVCFTSLFALSVSINRFS